MRPITFALVVSALLCFPSISPAAHHQKGDLPVVSLPFSNDLYIAGGNVVVTESAAGDLLAAGGSVIINGPVGADLMVAGGSVIVNSDVGDDLRAAGGDITLASRIGGDVLVYGGSVTIPTGVVVEGDAIVGAGTLHLGGTIRGDLKVDGGTVNFSGTVLGNAEFYADEQISLNGRIEGDTSFAASDVILGQNASFGGKVDYWTQDGEMDFSAIPVAGVAQYNPELKRQKHHGSKSGQEGAVRKVIAAAFGTIFVGTLLSGILAIVLGILLFKGTLREAGEILHLHFWKGFGIGLFTYVILPITAVIIMFTLIGIPVGLLVMVLFLFSVIFGRVIAAMVFAAWMERRQVAQWNTGRLMLASMGFFILFKLVNLVPFLGWIIVLLATFAGYGALVVSVAEKSRTRF